MNPQRARVTPRVTLKLRPHVSPRDPNAPPIGAIPVKNKGTRSVPSETASRSYVSDRGHHARWTE
jgi:hypothetical protein